MTLTERYEARQTAARRPATSDAGYVIAWLGGHTWLHDHTSAWREAMLVASAYGCATVYPVGQDGTLGVGRTVAGDRGRLDVAA